MNKSQLPILIVTALIIILAGGSFFLINSQKDSTNSQNSNDKSSEKMESDQEMMDNEESKMNTEMEKDDTEMQEDSMSTGEYSDYSEAKLANADSGDVVLFFKASWCPTCKTLDDNINTSLNDIPEDLTILKVDYDTELALKQKYGVTYQHTLVQVDSQGELLKKWSGSYSIDDISSQVI